MVVNRTVENNVIFECDCVKKCVLQNLMQQKQK